MSSVYAMNQFNNLGLQEIPEKFKSQIDRVYKACSQ